MSSLSSDISQFFSRKKILNVSFGFIFGLGLGLFIKDIFLWRRKEDGYLQEILKEICDIKLHIYKLQRKIKRVNNQNKSLDINKNNNAILDYSELDIFQDATSSLDGTESFYSFNEEMSDDCDVFVKEIDEILSESNSNSYEKCYELCSHNSWKFQDFSEFLWRYAMISYRTTIIQNLNQGDKIDRISTAYDSAVNAVKKAPRSSEAHKWLAILYGVTGLLSDTKKKILNGYKFKEHIDKCLELNPDDAYGYLLKGRFCFQECLEPHVEEHNVARINELENIQVSNLAFYERKLASLLFQTPPTSTLQEALLCFQKCEELSPNIYAENHYYLSECYKSLGDYAQSVRWLESAKGIPLKEYDEELRLKLQEA